MTNLAHFFQLRQVVTVTHAILVHHIQHDFPGAALLHFLHPVQGFPLRNTGTAFIAGILIDVILAGLLIEPGINPHHNTLHAKTVSQTGDQVRIGQSRGVDRNFVCPEGEDLRGVFRRLDPARDTERNIDHFRDA